MTETHQVEEVKSPPLLGHRLGEIVEKRVDLGSDELDQFDDWHDDYCERQYLNLPLTGFIDDEDFLEFQVGAYLHNMKQACNLVGPSLEVVMQDLRSMMQEARGETDTKLWPAVPYREMVKLSVHLGTLEGLTPSYHLVALWLLWFRNHEHGKFYPGPSLLAERAHVNIRTVERAMAWLQAHKVIIPVSRKGLDIRNPQVKPYAFNRKIGL